MKNNLKRLLCALVTVLLITAIIAPAVVADSSIVHLKTADDLRRFAEKCQLDVFSQDITVYLDSDIDLGNEPFMPIPTFSGEFYGQNHVISGFVLATDGNHQGLFRYLEEDAQLRDLTVKGKVEPGVGMCEVGGIVGTNRGTITNCSFSGTVTGEFFVGGIAGTSYGEISNCTSSGKINGKRCTGGIVGYTTAPIYNCKNLSSVNTTVSEGSLQLDQINLTGLSMTNLSTVVDTSFVSDTGGIAGFSQNGISECMNYGTVGYQHYGYNVGGIAGRCDRYISSCSNYGNIYGRKDVGGIIGHQEPSKILRSQTDLGSELTRLNYLVIESLYRATEYTQEIDDALDKLNADATAAGQKIAPDPAGITLSPDIMTLDSLTPVRTLTATFDEGISPSNLVFSFSDSTVATIISGPELVDGNTLEYKISGLKEGRATLSAVTADGLHSSNNVSIIVAGITRIDKISVSKDPALEIHSVGDTVSLVADITPANATNPTVEWTVANSDTEKVRIITETITSDTLRCQVKCIGKGLAKITATAADGSGVSGTVLMLIQDTGAGGISLSGEGSDKASEPTPAPAPTQQVDILPTPTPTPTPTLPPEQPIEALPTVEPTQVVPPSTEAPLNIQSSESDTLQPAPTVGAYSRDGGRKYMGTASVLSFQWPPEGLSKDFENLSNDFDVLNAALDKSSDIMIADLISVTNQLSVVLDIMNRILTHQSMDVYKDVSKQLVLGDPEGKVMDCVNNSCVEGDTNVGGLVGTMGVEYEFDMSDTIISDVLGVSLTQSTIINKYDAKCIQLDNINNGTVTAKKDNVGGIVGQMEFGMVSNCQGYGSTSSTDGCYVGGIVGRSNKAIYNCYSMCQLTGIETVGGIAGHAVEIVDCHTLVGINDVTACVGAIAGSIEDLDSVDEDTGKLLIRGNTFVKCGFGAIDGISYSGHAEEVSYEEMLEDSNLPEMFRELKLTFVANGVVVKEIPFTYGSSIPDSLIPQVPKLSGFNGYWPERDYTKLTYSDTIEAIYNSRQASVAAVETREDSPMPIVLLEGDFSDDAKVIVNEYSGNQPENEDAVLEKLVMRIENDDLTNKKYSIRYLIPSRENDSGKILIYSLDENNNWTQLETHRNGSYETFDAQGNTVVICAVAEEGNDYRFIMIIAAVAVIFLLLVIIIISSIRNSRKKKLNRKHSSGNAEHAPDEYPRQENKAPTERRE